MNLNNYFKQLKAHFQRYKLNNQSINIRFPFLNARRDEIEIEKIKNAFMPICNPNCI
jgi:hypothetical protein